MVGIAVTRLQPASRDGAKVPFANAESGQDDKPAAAENQGNTRSRSAHRLKRKCLVLGATAFVVVALSVIFSCLVVFARPLHPTFIAMIYKGSNPCVPELTDALPFEQSANTTTIGTKPAVDQGTTAHVVSNISTVAHISKNGDRPASSSGTVTTVIGTTESHYINHSATSKSPISENQLKTALEPAY